MNRFILIILAVSFPLLVPGQMLSLSDHYIYDALSINPSFAGCHDALSATISYRNQWVGFKDAPKSNILSIHTPFDNDRIGLGLLVEKNSIGIYKETSFIGNYSYRIHLHDGKLALGLGFGAIVYNIAWNELEATDPDDVLLLTAPKAAVLPDFSLGAYYYAKKYFIGFSMPLFLGHELDESTGKYRISNNFSGSNFFLTGGYEVGLSSNVKLLPSMLLKYHPGNVIQVDCYAQFNLKDRIWVGAGYRNRNMLIGMLQCQLNYQLRMAYSFDYQFGSIGKYVNDSHEIVLSYVFRYARNVISPRNF